MKNSYHTSKFALFSLMTGLFVTDAALAEVDTAAADPPSFDYYYGNWPAITVTGNNGQYTAVTSLGYPWQAEIQITAHGTSRIAHWSVFPTVNLKHGFGNDGTKPIGPDLEIWDIAQTYIFPRPKQVQASIGETINTILPAWAIAQCNARAQHMAENGASDTEIFGSDGVKRLVWNLKASIGYTWGVGSNLLGTDLVQGDPSPDESYLLCKKMDLPPPEIPMPTAGDIQTELPDFELIDAELTVFYTGSSECPVDVLLAGTVRSTGKGSFKLWYEHSDDYGRVYKSDKITMNTGNAVAPGVVETDYSKTISIPLPNFESVGGTVSSIPNQISDPAYKPGGTGGTGDGNGSPANTATYGTGIEDLPNVHKGKIRLFASTGKPTKIKLDGTVTSKQKVVSPGWQSYHITCDPTLDPQVVGSTGFTHKPAGTGEVVKFGSKATAKLKGLTLSQDLSKKGLRVISARDGRGRINFVLGNESNKALLNKEVGLYLPGKRKPVWSTKLTLRSGKRRSFNVKTSEFQLPPGVRGFQRFEFRGSDGRAMGDVLVAIEADPISGVGTATVDQSSIAAVTPSAKARLKVELTTSQTRLTEGDTITLDARIENIGGVASNPGVWTLQCTPGCPFPARGSYKTLTPGDAKRYHFTSVALEPGSYSVSVRIPPYGSSKSVRFVVAEKAKRTPDRRTPSAGGSTVPTPPPSSSRQPTGTGDLQIGGSTAN